MARNIFREELLGFEQNNIYKIYNVYILYNKMKY